MPKARMSTGVITDPPPTPVVPTSSPTPSPKRTISGSMSSQGSVGVQAALDLVGARPAAVAAGGGAGGVGAAARPGTPAGERGGGAGERRVPTVVQRVVGHVVGHDVGPDLGLGPIGQRAHLPQAVALVPADL